jgi:threonine/homoserine/homoserine lactone efflux protein
LSLAAGLIKSFGFGVSIAAAVGPIALLIIGYGLRGGHRSAVAAGLGAALADFAYAIVTFSVGALLLALLTGHEDTLRLISAGSLVLLGAWVAASTIRVAGRAAAIPAAGIAKPLLATFLMTAVNPLTVVLFVAFAAQLPLTESSLAVLAFAAALFLGSLTVQLVFALCGVALSRVVSRASGVRALHLLSGLAIAGFGVVGLWQHL